MVSGKQSIFRGDVYFASFSYSTGDEIRGTHPVVIVQNDIGNQFGSTVIGVVLTSRKKKEAMPTHVILEEPGTPCDGAMAMAEQIFTIDKQRLQGFVCHLHELSMTRVDEAVRQSLALNNKEPTLVSF